MKNADWIDIKKELPRFFMKVHYKMINGIEDCGWYNGKYFCTFDANSISEITHWKPLRTLNR